MQASGRYKLGRKRSTAKVRRKTGLRLTRDPPEDTLLAYTTNQYALYFDAATYYINWNYNTLDKIWDKAYCFNNHLLG